MYNLFVAYDVEAWDGGAWTTDTYRCVREYTDDELTDRFGDFSSEQVNELRRFPCIFAYEAIHEKDPKFGVIRDVAFRQGKSQVRVEYDIIPLDPFITAEQLSELDVTLDVLDWEMNRTHWAVKDVDLPRELQTLGVRFPHWARTTRTTVDITTHGFDVALSFPGAIRNFIEPVVAELERQLGPNSYFYDENYTSQLARPSLDILLQDIYRNRSKLVVVFLCTDYQNREWCGIEFQAIREMAMGGEHERIMFIRMDDGEVEGVLRNDGYIDASERRPDEIATFICERVELARQRQAQNPAQG